MTWSFLLTIFLFPGFLLPGVSDAQQMASTERSSAALGHYARTRALLVEALAEFEAGRKLARPDLLIDSEEWRLSLISRTEDLNRLLDPRPRVTRSGVQFKASPALLGRDSELPARVSDGAKGANTFIDQSTKTSATKSTAPDLTEIEKILNDTDGSKSSSPAGNKRIEKSDSSLSRQETPRNDFRAAEPSAKETILDNGVSTQAHVESPSTGMNGGNEQQVRPAKAAERHAIETPKPQLEASPPQEGNTDLDSDINQAVEDAIQERLKKLDGAEAEPAIGADQGTE